MRFFSPLLCLMVGLLGLPALATERVFLVPGATAGVTTRPGPRAGLDLSLLAGKCQDSCSGIGVTAGLLSASEREYYAGVAAGVAYFGSVWMDAAAHVKDGKASGFHVSYGMGFFLMGYLSLGYDALDRHPYGELGVTIKAPVVLD